MGNPISPDWIKTYEFLLERWWEKRPRCPTIFLQDLHGVRPGEVPTRQQEIEKFLKDHEDWKQQEPLFSESCITMAGFPRSEGFPMGELNIIVAKTKSRTQFGSPDCPKCGGAGWLWGREIDGADEETVNDTMTKYHCDSPECEEKWRGPVIAG
jgi:hypothetical protein